MPEQSPDNPIVELLIKPENVGLACEIYNAFPDVVQWVGKVRLLKILRTECRKRLSDNGKWDVSLDPEDNRALLKEEWPGINVMPHPASDSYWYLCLELNARKNELPFTLSHGVAYQPDDTGGRPQSMSQKLQAEVEKIEGLFKDKGLKVRPWPNERWFSWTDKPYKRYTLGTDPRVLTKISSGALADEIADEFSQFFDEWSSKIERLNSMIG
jgi:hypothetical protein